MASFSKNYAVDFELTYYQKLENFLLENRLPYKLRVPNSNNGNYKFESLTDQIELHNIPGVPRNHELLREFICNSIVKLPQLKYG